jgi:hypothetical protein
MVGERSGEIMKCVPDAIIDWWNLCAHGAFWQTTVVVLCGK